MSDFLRYEVRCGCGLTAGYRNVTDALITASLHRESYRKHKIILWDYKLARSYATDTDQDALESV